MFLCFLLVLVNLSPVLPTDGYTILMDWFMIPDLRQRALRYLFSGDMYRGLRQRPLSREKKIFTAFGLFVGVFMCVTAVDSAFSVNRILGGFLHQHLGSQVALGAEVLIVCLTLFSFMLSMLNEAGITGRRRR
jgi:hypothetical protein